MNKKTKTKSSSPINIEDMYQHYLKLCNLDETNMHLVQKIETKRAFMGGCMEALTVLLDIVNHMEEEESIKAFEDLFDQIGKHFKEGIIIRKKSKK